MSRLIDADKIPEVSCDPKEEAAFRQTIDEQPTIEAIPISFLKKKCIKPFQDVFMSDSISYMQIVHEYNRIAEERNQIIDEIISLWRAEQAERKEE